MRTFRALGVLGLVLLLAGSAFAQPPPDQDLHKRVQDLEKQVQELKELLKKKEKPAPEGAATKEELNKLEKVVESLKPGLENFLLTGYAFGVYEDIYGKGDYGTFNVGFNPVFLWSLSDNLLFEGELELEIEDGETETALEYAQIAYFLHDSITVGAGKFLLPFGIFPERLHPAWINKLPTFPIPAQHHGGLVPFSDVGAQIRGGIPLGADARANYAVYVTNGPSINTGGHHAGELTFNNTADNNSNKAVGGRIGILPIPELEVGFSYQRARVDPSDFEDIDVNLFAADLSYVRESDLVAGLVDVRFEWFRQDIENTIYVVNGAPFDFDNEKSAWYAQIAYRPTLLDVPILPNVEVVFRYTNVDWASDTPWPGGVDRQQFSVGLNYWIAENAVVKVGYDINDNLQGPEDGENVFTVQAAYGF